MKELVLGKGEVLVLQVVVVRRVNWAIVVVVRAAFLRYWEHWWIWIQFDIFLALVSVAEMNTFILTVLANLHVVTVTSFQEASFAEANQQKNQQTKVFDIHPAIYQRNKESYRQSQSKIQKEGGKNEVGDNKFCTH